MHCDLCSIKSMTTSEMAPYSLCMALQLTRASSALCRECAAIWNVFYSHVATGPKLSHEASDESVTKLSIDSQRLATFLRSASQV